MKPFHQYWTFSAIRGAMTLLAALAIVAIPQAAASMLSIPVMVAIAVNCLATYSFFDAAVMVLLGNLLPARGTRPRALYAQAAMAMFTGALLFFIAYGIADLRWLMWIAAAQAGLAAVAEFSVARSTHAEYGCLSCYSTVMVLVFSAFCLPFAGSLGSTGMSLMLASYVGIYGSSELLLGARMLFLDYRSEHPATHLSQAWQAEMFMARPATLGPLALRQGKAAKTCSVCPAAPLCLDASLSGQLAGIASQAVPALIRSVRLRSVLGPAA